jgi:hypothetical protein
VRPVTDAPAGTEPVPDPASTVGVTDVKLVGAVPYAK